jgi:hypothetical protein
VDHFLNQMGSRGFVLDQNRPWIECLRLFPHRTFQSRTIHALAQDMEQVNVLLLHYPGDADPLRGHWRGKLESASTLPSDSKLGPNSEDGRDSSEEAAEVDFNDRSSTTNIAACQNGGGSTQSLAAFENSNWMV